MSPLGLPVISSGWRRVNSIVLEDSMARQMTERELLELYELNKRLVELHAESGEEAEVRRLVCLIGELEKHLYQYNPALEREWIDQLRF